MKTAGQTQRKQPRFRSLAAAGMVILIVGAVFSAGLAALYGLRQVIADSAGAANASSTLAPFAIGALLSASVVLILLALWLRNIVLNGLHEP